MFKVGLCSFRKTGNYLFIKILRDLLSENYKWNTFSKENNLWKSYFNNFKSSYPFESEIDELVFLERNQWQLYKGAARFNLDYEKLKKVHLTSNFILTHEKPHLEIFNNSYISSYKWFYLIRDIGPTLNSLIKFLASDDIVERTPGYHIRDPKKLLFLDGYFEKCIEAWIDHVKGYLEFEKKFKLIKYENIIENKINFINNLSKSLNIDGNLKKIASSSSFENMKKAAPNHVRSGDQKEFQVFFDKNQITYMFNKSYDLRKILGYA